MGNSKLPAAYVKKAAGRVMLLFGMCLLLFLTNSTDHTFIKAKDASGESDLTPSGDITLTTDVTLTEPWEITGHVTLDLNGHKLQRNLSDYTRSGEVICLRRDASISIYDNSSAQTGAITGGYSSNYSGGIYGYPGSRIYLYSGAISGNKSRWYGGGVYLDSGAKIYIYGGRIYDNTASSSYGGGIYADKDSEVHLLGGKIIGNTADKDGGGIYTYKATSFFYGGEISSNRAKRHGGGVYLCNASDERVSQFTGTDIKNNTAENSGGGIFADYNACLSLTSGVITDNCGSTGGGVYVEDGTTDKCDITVGGNVQIIGNRTSYNSKHPEMKNLTLGNGSGTGGAKIKLSSFSSTAKIGIAGLYTEYYCTEDNSADYAKYFICDESGYRIALSDSNLYMDENVLRRIPITKSDEKLSAPEAVDEKGTKITLSRADSSNRKLSIQVPKEDGTLSNYTARIKVDSDATVTKADGTSLTPKTINGNKVYEITQDFSSQSAYITLSNDYETQNWEICCTTDTAIAVATVTVDGSTQTASSFGWAWHLAAGYIENGKTVELTLFDNWTASDSNGDLSQGLEKNPYIQAKGFKNGQLHLAKTGAKGKLILNLNGFKIDRKLNSPIENGGIMYLENMSVTITDTSKAKTGTMTGGNTTGNGGAIYTKNTDLTLENITLSGNQADNGSAIYASGGTLTINGGKITQNTSTDSNGSGYAVCIDETADTPTVTKITGAEISQNVGGGLFLVNHAILRYANISSNGKGSNQPTIGGGIHYKRKPVRTGDDTLILDNCVIYNNIAQDGAGIYMDSASDSVNEIILYNCLIVTNSATGTNSAGGGIYTNAQKNTNQTGTMWLKLNNCVVTKNKASKGAGLYAKASSDVETGNIKYNKLSLGGVTYIRENTSSVNNNTSSNVLLSKGSILTSADNHYQLTGNASIGILSEVTGHDMVAITDNNHSFWENKNQYIVSDDPENYYVAFHPELFNGTLCLVKGKKEAEITKFGFEEYEPDDVTSKIDKAANRITVTVPQTADLTKLTPKITVSAGADYTPADWHDFSSSVIYTVQNGSYVKQNWTVTVIKNDISTYPVSVTNGKIILQDGTVTGNHNYGPNKLVSVKADEISGKAFKCWTSQDITLRNPTDMETAFIMPSKPVTLTAEYDTIVPVVELTIDTPIAGRALPEKASIKTGESSEEKFDIHWNPYTEVKAFTSYEASITVPAKEGYCFDDTTKVKINGSTAEGKINADGSITVTGEVAAYAKLKEIKNPEPISVPYGTELKDIALPDTLAITLEGADDATADVIWQIGMKGDPILDPESEEYDSDAKEYKPTQSGRQEFTGTVYLPAGVLTEDEKKITKTITINVGEQEHAGVPMADLPEGYYTESKTVSLTARDGAVIYYTTDGTDPKTSKSRKPYDNTPIELTGEAGKEITTTIRAYATESGKIDSETADFKYTIAVPVPTYTLTVENGKGSGEYKAGEKVAIIADEQEGKTFYRWDTQNTDVKLDNRYAKTTFFEMPAAKDGVTITAKYHDNIKSIALTIAAPKKGQALPLKADWTIIKKTGEVTEETEVTAEQTEGISSAVLSWTPNSDKAGAYTTYTASIRLQADKENAYVFAETVTATVNGNTAFVTKNEDGTVIVTYSFTTDKAVLLGINQPADVSGIKNGTPAADIANSLPKIILLKTDDGTRYAGVEWTSPAETAYNPAEREKEQSFTVSGTVNLPEDTEDSQQIGTDVWINVTVNKADQAAAPIANIPGGAYPAELNITLSSATDGADIYYTTDSSISEEVLKTKYSEIGTKYTEPIKVKGTEGETKETTIKAVAVKGNMQTSPVVTYKYTITLPAPTYQVTVENGTGSGEYKEGDTVIIMADAEKEDETFYRWNVKTGDAKPDNNRSKATYFIMPKRDVTISAEFRQKIKRIDLNINTPARNEKLPSQAECSTTGIAKTSLVWTPNDTTAGTYKTYTASIRIESDTENAFRFADNAMAYVNGNRAELTTNEDGTVTATCRFTTEKAVLREIRQPEAVSGIANGTTMEKIIASLPQFATLDTNDGDKYAKVTWNATPAEGSYNPNRTTAQTFTLSGTVTLPEDTDNPREIALSVQLKVTVSEADITGAPVADIPGGEYTDNLNIVLTSTTDGANIYYTTDGITPTEASALYKTAIPVKGNPGETVETTIKAVAVKEHMQASRVVTYTYRITLPAKTYTVTVNGGAGSGTYKAGDYVLIMADAAQKDKTFVKWNVVKGGAEPDNIYDAFAYFIMPAEDVEITAEFKDKINKVELEINAPTTGEAFKTDILKCKTNLTADSEGTQICKEITDASLFWTPTDRKAGACKNYVASIRLEPDKKNFCEFADSVTATVKGTGTTDTKKAVVTKNEDGTITVICSFTTGKATLDEIKTKEFASVSGIANGTNIKKILSLLPQFAVLKTNDGEKYGKVEWNQSSTPEYNPDEKNTDQTFKLTGTVIPPDDTEAPESADLTVSISVTVSKKDTIGMPIADIPAGTYPEDLEVSLTATTTGSSIYYTTNNKITEDDLKADFNKGTKYTEPIKVTDEFGKETTIRAIAVIKDTSGDTTEYKTSNVVTYNYTINKPVKYTLTVKGGKGGGKYEEGTVVTVIANVPAKNQTFIGWNIPEQLASVDKTKKILTFEMPANDVEVEALYLDKITEAELTVHAPEAGKTLDTGVISCSGAGIQTPAIQWNTKDTVAQYNKEYWAVITLTPDSSHEFADSVALTVNEKKVTPKAATNGSLIAYASFKTAKAKLLTIEKPSDITGENGASLAKILPKTVKVQTEGQLITEADAVWKIKDVAYNPNSSQTQKFTVTGTADIPKEIDTAAVGTSISVNVTIQGRYVPYPVEPVGPIIPPSASPSATPTATPTADPGVGPVIPPSALPSATPTATPSQTPAVTPTAIPSQTPAVTPTITPSATPTVTPTITPSATPTVTPAITPSTAPTKTPATRKPTATPKPTAKAKVTYNFRTLKARTVKQGKTSVTLKWSKVSKADGYLIYGSRCSKGKTYKTKLLKTIKGSKTLTWTQKKLKKGTSYQYQVKAYRTVKGKKVITDKSIVVHAVTKGGKYCVPSKVQVTKLAGKKVKNPKKALSLTLKKGKTAKITAAAKPADKKKKLTRHRSLCYESSNTKVAKVGKTGKIKAVKKGSCTIWVYAENGVYKTIKVKVK